MSIFQPINAYQVKSIFSVGVEHHLLF